MQLSSGTIKDFNEEKGFGFIALHDVRGVQQDVFFHVSDFHPNFSDYQPKKGDIVEFFIKNDEKGDKAVKLRKAVTFATEAEALAAMDISKL